MDTPSNHISTYHVAGLDERERGFNRQIQMISCAGGFQARLRYERLQIEIDPVPTETEALSELVQKLHKMGYRQLRTQRIFLGDQYLGTQELWTDYSDPESPGIPKETWIMRLRRIFRFGNEG